MQDLVARHFVPVKLRIDESAAIAQRYKVRFTPTILVLTPEGEAIQESTGFLPPDEYVAFVSLGRAKALLDGERLDEAIAILKEVTETSPETSAAPEALYWWAVAEYKKTHAPEALKEIWKRLERYPESIWKKKVSFAFEEARAGEARERTPREPGTKGS